MLNIDIKVMILTCLIGLFWCWVAVICMFFIDEGVIPGVAGLTMLLPITFVVLRQACRDWKS